MLKHNTPENLGIPSDAALNFVEHLERRKIPLHSFMIIRRGEIAAEGYYPPFAADTLHRMYSQSKTFVAVAVGLLIDEGKLKLTDKIADFFPEHRPDNMHEYVANATVRDLLMMATPYLYNNYSSNAESWTKPFFTQAASHRSGELFNYDTGGTVMLNAIVEKVSGKELIEYMRPKLLDWLGFSKNARCIQRPEGGAWGGSGVLCSTHDIAKFALFLLNKGKWDGKQLLSEEYAIQATSAQIDNRISSDSPEFQYGYGYQIWRTRNNGFAMVGMGSQLSVCAPDKDMVLITTADTQFVPHGTDIILDSFWTHVYARASDEKLPENPKEREKLDAKLKNLAFAPVEGKPTSGKSLGYSGKKYMLEPNRMNISEVRFDFEGAVGTMKYRSATGDHEIKFGICGFSSGEFPETHYYGDRICEPKGSGYRYKASGAWFDDETLIIYLYIIDDYLGTLKIEAKFHGGNITLFMRKVAEWFLDEYEGIANGSLA